MHSFKHALNERHERQLKTLEEQHEHHEADPEVHLHPDDHGKLGHLHDWGKRVWIFDLKRRIKYTKGLLEEERAKSAQLTEDLAGMTSMTTRGLPDQDFDGHCCQREEAWQGPPEGVGGAQTRGSQAGKPFVIWTKRT